MERNVCTPTSTTCEVFLMESAGNSFVASEPIVIRHFDVVLRFNDVNIVVAVSAQQFVTCRFSSQWYTTSAFDWW